MYESWNCVFMCSQHCAYIAENVAYIIQKVVLLCKIFSNSRLKDYQDCKLIMNNLCRQMRELDFGSNGQKWMNSLKVDEDSRDVSSRFEIYRPEMPW